MTITKRIWHLHTSMINSGEYDPRVWHIRSVNTRSVIYTVRDWHIRSNKVFKTPIPLLYIFLHFFKIFPLVYKAWHKSRTVLHVLQSIKFLSNDCFRKKPTMIKCFNKDTFCRMHGNVYIIVNISYIRKFIAKTPLGKTSPESNTPTYDKHW